MFSFKKYVPDLYQLSLFLQAVAVHCFHGRGRTGTILACYLVKSRGMKAKDAITYVRRKRPLSVETKEQVETVFVYEQIIKDSN